MSDQRTRITRHLRALVGERHPDTSPQALRRAAQYLETGFAQLDWATMRQSFRARGKIYHNILAVKSVPDGKQRHQAPPLLIGAHYDTVVGSPGADDNASALSVLLEVACRFRDDRLARPVWLAAFCLEEQGLLGSRALTSKLKQINQALHGAVILESVGYASQQAGSQRTPPGVPIAVPSVGNFLGIIGNEASRALLVTIQESATRGAPQLPIVALTVPGRGETLPDTRRSDHAAFWDAGFPAVMLTDTADFRNPHYHRSTDTIDTLDLAFLEAVTDLVMVSVEALTGPDGA